jgi:hypothetical protein
VRCSFACESTRFVPDFVGRFVKSCVTEIQTMFEVIFEANSRFARTNNVVF